MSFFYFLILIGVLVFVHELGHFLVAKYFGVKVLRFAIGMGPTLFSFQRGETEYALCALPLGGYVQMLGSDLESVEEMPAEERGRALMAKPIWQRSLIVLAGPLANVLLPLAIYFTDGMLQDTRMPTVIGQVFEGSAADKAGLKPGDRVVAIDGKPVAFWHEVTRVISTSYDEPVNITVERDGAEQTVTARPQRKTQTDALGLNPRTYGMLGINLGTFGTTVAIADPKGAAAKAGLQLLDRIVMVDGKFVTRLDEVESLVRQGQGRPMSLVVMRRHPVEAGFARLNEQEFLTLQATPLPGPDGYTLGVEPSERYVAVIEPDSAAERAGLRVGDRLVAVDGAPHTSWQYVEMQVYNLVNERIVARDSDRKNKDASITPTLDILVRRDGQDVPVRLTPTVLEYSDENRQPRQRIAFGWQHMRDAVFPDPVHFPLGKRFMAACSESFERTTGFVGVMLTGFLRMAQGRVGMDNIGGPIMIGEMAAEAGRAGLSAFLSMMALISLNLAVINMLPIPVLDGGHLLLFTLEAIKRGPLSFRTRQIATYIGFTFIIFLMIFAFKNDIERNWHRVADYFNES